MKKQFLILATITTIVFTSCSKEKIETQQSGNFEEVATAKKPGGGNSFTPVSNKGLLGRFEFDSNLEDTTGQLHDGVSTVGRVLYTTDRKGQANKALRFNEAYGVNIFDVPIDDEMSISIWVKNDFFPDMFTTSFVDCAQTFTFAQLEDEYVTGYWTPFPGPSQVVISNTVDNKWHHLAATRDGSSYKFYIDGVLIGSAPTPPGSDPQLPADLYQLGYGYNLGYKYWKGDLDDLRIYKRVLSVAEIIALANS